MELKFDLDKVVKIVIEKDENNLLEYKIENGLIVGVSEYSKDGAIKKVLSDTEMINKIRHSEFMNELDKAKKKYKLAKEIDDNFPEQTENGDFKVSKPTSEESINIIKEIIKKDLDGTLDNIVREKMGAIERQIHSKFDDDENKFDADSCQSNMRKVEQKLLSIIRKNGGKIKDNEEFSNALDNYADYSKKYHDLSNKVWKKLEIKEDNKKDE